MNTMRRPLSVRVASASLAVVFAHASVQPAFALPRGERVTRGEAGFERTADTLIINQASGRAVIEYDGFDIGSAEAVRFNQPDASAAALNRVTGGSASVIAGALQANGNVFIVNPAGVIFSGGARVDVHGLVASAMNITDDNFLSGKLEFSGGGGRVVNQGTINAAYAYLIGSSVENSGTINAADVALQAGQGTIRLGEAADGEINLVVSEDPAAEPLDPAPAAAGLEAEPAVAKGDLINEGVVNASGAAGGRVQVQGTRVANLGSLLADGSAGKGGEIAVRAADQIVLGAESVTSASGGGAGGGGTITFIAQNQFVSAPTSVIRANGGEEGGEGGFVETSGLQGFRLGSTPQVSGGGDAAAGEWRIDPYNIEIGNFSFNQDMLTFLGSPWQPTGQDAQVAISQIIGFFSQGGGTLRINTADDFDSIQLGGFVREPHQLGNITLVDNLDFNGIGTGKLILQAHNDIVLNGAIGDSDAGTADKLDLVLEADWRGLPAGSPDQTIRPVPGPQNPTALVDGPDSDGLGSVFLNAGLSTGGGSLTASGQNITQALGSAISLGAGAFTLTGDVDQNGSGDVILSGSTSAASARITGQNITLAGSLGVNAGNAELFAAKDLTVSGSLAVTGSTSAGAQLEAGYPAAVGHLSVTSSGAVTSTGFASLTGDTVAIDGITRIDFGGGALSLSGRDGVTIGAGATVIAQTDLNLRGDQDNDLTGDLVANALVSTGSFAGINASGHNVRLLGGVSAGFATSLQVVATGNADVGGTALFDGDYYINALSGQAKLSGNVYTRGGGVFVEAGSVLTADGVIVDTNGGDLVLHGNNGITLGASGLLDTTFDNRLQLAALAGDLPPTGLIHLDGDVNNDCLGAVLLGSDLLTGGGAVLIHGGSVSGAGDIDTTGFPGVALGSITIGACDDITVSGNYLSDGHDIRLTADTDADLIGDLSSTGTMGTQGGIFAGGGVNASQSGQVTSQGGAVTLTARGNASLGPAGTSGGAVTVTADDDANGSGEAAVTGNVFTGSGNVVLSGQSARTSDAVVIDTDGGYISISSRAGVTLGIGGILDTRPAAPVLAGGSLAAGQISIDGDDDANCLGDVAIASDLFTGGADIGVHGANVIGIAGMQTQGGAIRISACDDLALFGGLATGGGLVDLQADTDADAAGLLSHFGTTQTGGGSFTGHGFSVLLGGSVATTGGQVDLRASDDLFVTGILDARNGGAGGNILLSADDGSRLASDGQGDAGLLADGQILTSGYAYVDIYGQEVLLSGQVGLDYGGLYVGANGSIFQSGGRVDTYGGQVRYRAQQQIALTDGAYIDTTGGSYYGNISLTTRYGDILIADDSSLVVEGYDHICLLAGDEGHDGNVFIGGGLYAEYGNIEVLASGDIVIGEFGEIITEEAEFVLDGNFFEYASGNIILIAGHQVLTDYEVSYDSFLEADGDGDLVQLGGLVESWSGDVLGIGHTIGLLGGAFYAHEGYAGLRSIGSTVLNNDLHGTVVLVEAGGGISVDGEVTAHDTVLLEANGGEILGEGYVYAPVVGLKAHGTIGSGAGIEVEADSLFVIEQTLAGDRNLRVLGADPSENSAYGYLNLNLECMDGGKGKSYLVAHGPDIVINGTITRPEPEPGPKPEPRRPRRPAVEVPGPLVLPEIELSRLLARFAVDVPNFKERVKIFEEFYFLHMTMQVSEFAMDLDLNFIDYLLFGEARIQSDAPFPAEAKDTIYIGGVRPYRIGGAKSPGYQGSIQ